MRRLALILVLGCSFALVGSESASAYSGGPNTPINNPANLQQVKSLLRNYGNANPAPYGTNAATGSAATAAEVESGLTLARGRAAILPRVSTFSLGILAMAAAGYTGWKIGSPIGGWVYKRITGETYGGSTSSLTLSQVRWVNQSGTSRSGFFGGNTMPTNSWALSPTANSDSYSCGTLATVCPAGLRTQFSAFIAASIMPLNWGQEEQHTGGNGNCSSITPTAGCAIYWLSNAQFEKNVNVSSDTAAGYAAAALQRDASTWAPPATTSDAETQEAIDSIGGNDSTTGTKAQEAAVGAINHVIDPNWGIGEPAPPPIIFTPFAIPEPDGTMTYQQYVATLRARGWLGTLTIEPASALEAAADPASAYALAPLHAPAGVLVSGNPIVWWFDVGAPTPGDHPDPSWPDNPPHIPTANTPVTIKEKPGTSVFPPPSGGGGCDCTIPSIDFGPLADIDVGDAFPFGVFGWIGDIFDPFNVTPDAPVFNFDVSCPDLAPCETVAFGPVDLEVMDDYVADVKLLLSVLLWIGAVWLLAVKLLGFHAGGDLGEAADDVFEDGRHSD